MRGDGRYRLVLGLALGASLAFLAFLLPGRSAATASSWSPT
jgi:uncharacterized membrane protein YgaE (UPF0421/DUF939 family)